jgi:branched-chain amino acid transport system permease protein
MSENYRIEQSTPASRVGTAVGLGLVVALFAAPWWAGRADLRLFGEIYIYIALASLWNLLAGYTGLVSVGQQLYVGLGGYVLFALALFLGVSPLVAIPAAGVAGILIALPVSWLLFRLQGAYFAIGTWVAAEAFMLGFAQVPALGGGSGTSLPTALVAGLADTRQGREWLIYWVGCGLVLISLGVVFGLLRSKIGLALTAIRDSEIASESLGIDIGRTKLLVYLITSGLTAMLGALIFLQKLRITPEAAFSVNNWTAYVIFIVVIGGIGTIEGPIIGALAFFILRETLADFGAIYLFMLGLAAVAAMLKAPKGLWGTFSERTGIVLFPVRRRVAGLSGEGSPAIQDNAGSEPESRN